MTGNDKAAWGAVAHLYHNLFTGLILTVVTRKGAPDAARWMQALFRAQHEAKFLQSFEKLGLTGMPPAQAAAAYHYLSNRIGGVDVEYIAESPRKAWVRFPPPRWVYPGPAICAIPSEVSRAMLRGWYAQNGVTLGVPGLGFVCTGQTVDGQPGLEGSFIEEDHPLAPEERLRFLPGEQAPPFNPDGAPEPPSDLWPPERLAKARRNYAMEYLRTGLPMLFEIFGTADARHLGHTACWLIGAQLWQEMAERLEIAGRDGRAATDMLAALATGEGDQAAIRADGDAEIIERTGFRLWHGLGPQPPELFEVWAGLQEGLVAGMNRALRLSVTRNPTGALYRIDGG